jgi:hypothetical protein
MDNKFEPGAPKPKQVPSAPDSQEERPKGRRICAWCKKDMGGAETEQDTHGMCEECLARVKKEEGLE